MVRRTIKLLVFAVFAHAVYRIVPPFWSFFQFKDAVQEAANYADAPSFSGRRPTPEQLLDRLVKAAQDTNVPVGREDFLVTSKANLTTIDVRYGVKLEYFPRHYHPYEFIVHAEGGPSKYRSVAAN